MLHLFTFLETLCVVARPCPRSSHIIIMTFECKDFLLLSLYRRPRSYKTVEQKTFSIFYYIIHWLCEWVYIFPFSKKYRWYFEFFFFFFQSVDDVKKTFETMGFNASWSQDSTIQCLRPFWLFPKGRRHAAWGCKKAANAKPSNLHMRMKTKKKLMSWKGAFDQTRSEVFSDGSDSNSKPVDFEFWKWRVSWRDEDIQGQLNKAFLYILANFWAFMMIFINCCK